MARAPAVITHDEARNVHRLEVRQSEICQARKIVIVPASVGCADQAAAVSVIGQDDSIVSESRDDDGRLWAGGGTRRSRDGSLQSIDLSGRPGHGAAFRW